jgi:LCP family protein required for cell wall assembly
LSTSASDSDWIWETNGRRGKRRGKPRRRVNTVLKVVGIVVLLVLLLVAFLIFWLNRSLDNVTRTPITLPNAGRPADNNATDILIMGADSGTARNGAGSSIVADAAKDVWPAGKNRSDATMLLHIDSAKKRAYVISIPRDTYVPIIDGRGKEHGKAKVNAALSIYGPSAAVGTVENLTGVHVDHIAMTDWDGFTSLIDLLGGVTLRIENGTAQRYDGEAALFYVRERYHLPNGDFDRVKRQQNLLRSIAQSVLERGLIQNPLHLKSILDAITGNLAVDGDWGNGEIRSMALSMRHLRPNDMAFATIPIKGTASDPVAGSIDVLDEPADAELFKALREDAMDQWVQAHQDRMLGNFVY